MPTVSPARTIVLTLLTLVAFAANSLFCRLALVEATIDPVSFTAIRLGSGALILLPFVWPRSKPVSNLRWSPLAGLSLFAYAIGFSLAYVTLDTGVGALLLFGAVQVSMLGFGFVKGERLSRIQIAGLVAAIAGLVVQVRPGLDAPEPLGVALMVLAGVAWGVYSLLGREVANPRAATARNFLLAAPLGAACLLFASGRVELELAGVLLAVISGALTSGLGYVLWYAALPGHSATSAALVQLAVPILAAAGGMLFLTEEPSPRFALAALLTLGGIAAAITGKRRRAPG